MEYPAGDDQMLTFGEYKRLAVTYRQRGPVLIDPCRRLGRCWSTPSYDAADGKQL